MRYRSATVADFHGLSRHPGTVEKNSGRKPNPSDAPVAGKRNSAVPGKIGRNDSGYSPT
jgi:hypothetical protein